MEFLLSLKSMKRNNMFSTLFNITILALAIIGMTLTFTGTNYWELVAFCYALPAGVACADAVYNLIEE